MLHAIRILIICTTLLLAQSSFSVELANIGSRQLIADTGDNWVIDKQSSDQNVAAIVLRAKNASLLVNVVRLSSKKILNSSDDEFRQLARMSMMAMAVSAVDKTPPLQMLKLAEGRGYFARFSDAKWQDKTPPSGRWAKTTAAIVLLDGYMLNATLLSQDFDSEAFRSGVGLLHSLQLQAAVR